VTDLERYCAMLRGAGIEHGERTKVLAPFGACTCIDVEQSHRGLGYPMMGCTHAFDSDGKLVAVGSWE